MNLELESISNINSEIIELRKRNDQLEKFSNQVFEIIFMHGPNFRDRIKMILKELKKVKLVIDRP